MVVTKTEMQKKIIPLLVLFLFLTNTLSLMFSLKLAHHPNQEFLELKPAMVGALSDPTASQKVSALLVDLHCRARQMN